MFKRGGRVPLVGMDRVEAASDDLGDEGGGDQADGDHRDAEDRKVDAGKLEDEEHQHQRDQERDAAEQFDEGDARLSFERPEPGGRRHGGALR